MSKIKKGNYAFPGNLEKMFILFYKKKKKRIENKFQARLKI